PSLGEAALRVPRPAEVRVRVSLPREEGPQGTPVPPKLGIRARVPVRPGGTLLGTLGRKPMPWPRRKAFRRGQARSIQGRAGRTVAWTQANEESPPPGPGTARPRERSP